jgi:hypothetical protein
LAKIPLVGQEYDDQGDDEEDDGGDGELLIDDSRGNQRRSSSARSASKKYLPFTAFQLWSKARSSSASTQEDQEWNATSLSNQVLSSSAETDQTKVFAFSLERQKA